MGSADPFDDLPPVAPVVPLQPRRKATLATPAIVSASDLKLLRLERHAPFVDGLIYPGLTLLAGKSKIGKSWFSTDLADAQALGKRFLDHFDTTAVPVLLCALEDSLIRLQDRMRRLKGEFVKWPENLNFATELKPISAGGLDQLREMVAKTGARVVIVDTFGKLRGAGDTRNRNAYQADYSEIGQIKALADELRIAIILVHHLKKGAADDPLDEINGTNGLAGAADCIIILKRSRVSSDGTLYATGRDLREIDLSVKFDTESCRWSVVGDREEIERSDARNRIIIAIQQSNEPLTPKQIAEAADLSHASVKHTVRRMCEAEQIVRVSNGKYTLPRAGRDFG